MEVDASNGSGSGRSNGSGVSGQDAADSDSNWWLGRNGQAAADMDMGGEEDSSYETLLLGHGNGRDRGELVNTIAAGEDDGGYYNEALDRDYFGGAVGEGKMGGGTTEYYGDGGVKIGKGGGDSPDSGCCLSVAPSSLTGNTSPAAGLKVEDEEVSGRRVSEKEQQAVVTPPRRRKVVIIRRPQTKGHEEHSLQVACPKIAVFYEEKEEALKKPVLLERCFVSRPPFSALADNPSHFLPKSLQEAVAMVEEGEGENEAEPARKRCRPNRRGASKPTVQPDYLAAVSRNKQVKVMIDAGENRYGPQEANQSGAKKGGRNAPRLGKSAAGKIKQLAAELLAAGGENQVGTGNLPAENAALRRRVAELTADNRALAAQLRTLQGRIGGSQKRRAAASASLAVMLLSVCLLVAPSGSSSMAHGLQLIQRQQQLAAVIAPPRQQVEPRRGNKMEICNYPPALANSGRFREGRGKHHAASPWSAGTGTGSWGNEEDGESGGGREMRQNTINPVEISHSSWPFANDNYVNEEFTANKATNDSTLLPLAFADGGELISDNQLYSSVTADSSVFDDFGGDWLFENCPGFLREEEVVDGDVSENNAVGVAATNFYSPRNETDLSSFDLGRNLFAEDGCDWSSGGPDLLEAEEEEFHFNQDGGDHRLSPTETRTLVGLDDESLIRLALGDCGRGDGEELLESASCSNSSSTSLFVLDHYLHGGGEQEE